MARPVKCRKIHFSPDVSYLKPAGIALRNLEEVGLTLDEVEAIRLADLETCYQEVAAEEMNVSRQTFGNIIKSARKKIADALINGKAIKIEGGVYQMSNMRTFTCSNCNHEWKLAFGTGRPVSCPECKSNNIHRAPKDMGFSRKGVGRCRRHKRQGEQQL